MDQELALSLHRACCLDASGCGEGVGDEYRRLAIGHTAHGLRQCCFRGAHASCSHNLTLCPAAAWRHWHRAHAAASRGATAACGHCCRANIAVHLALQPAELSRRVPNVAVGAAAAFAGSSASAAAAAVERPAFGVAATPTSHCSRKSSVAVGHDARVVLCGAP